MTDLTCDTIFSGLIKINQPRFGYRFSLDALLLADFSGVEPGMTVIDLGAGAGVIALALGRRMGRGRVVAVEVQPRLQHCARLNVEANPWSAVNIEVMAADWNDLSPDDIGGKAQYAVSNPPYRRLGTGRINPNDEEAVARHELLGNAATAAQAARRVLGVGGRLAVIYPAARLAGLLADLRGANLEPKRLRLVHSRSDHNARLVLVEALVDGHEELSVMPPLFIYGQDRKYTPEVRSILAGGTAGGPENSPVDS